MSTMTTEADDPTIAPTMPPTIKQDLNNTGNAVQQGAVQVQTDIKNLPEDVQRMIHETFQTAKVALTDYSGSISREASSLLCKSNGWAALCVFGVLVGEIVGKMLGHLILDGIFGSWTNFFVYSTLMPTLIWAASYQLKQGTSSMGPQLVMFFSIGFGFLIGATIANLRSSFVVPPLFILPLSIASAAYIAGPPSLKDRKVFIPMMLTPALFAYLLIGMDDMSSSYVFYMTILLAAAIIDIQMKIDANNRGSVMTLENEQWKSIVLFSIADLVAYSLTAEKIQ